jgi:hypothetical protein
MGLAPHQPNAGLTQIRTVLERYAEISALSPGQLTTAVTATAGRFKAPPLRAKTVGSLAALAEGKHARDVSGRSRSKLWHIFATATRQSRSQPVSLGRLVEARASRRTKSAHKMRA